MKKKSARTHTHTPIGRIDARRCTRFTDTRCLEPPDAPVYFFHVARGRIGRRRIFANTKRIPSKRLRQLHFSFDLFSRSTSVTRFLPAMDLQHDGSNDGALASVLCHFSVWLHDHTRALPSQQSK